MSDLKGGDLYHLLKRATTPPKQAKGVDTIYRAMVARARAMQEDRAMDEQAERWLYDNQWG